MAVFALAAVACAQVVNFAVDYKVPAGWNHFTEPSVKITSPDGLAMILLGVETDPRPAADKVAEVGDPLAESLHSVKVISRGEFSIAGQTGARMEFEGKRSRRGELNRYTLICVKRESACATIIVVAPAATYENYRAGIERVINSVRIVNADAEPDPQPAVPPLAKPSGTPATNLEYSSAALGMKITLQPGWKLKSEAPGQYSGTPKSTFVPESGNAMVSLSVDENSMTHKHHVADVLKNLRNRSKSLNELGESPVTMAGLAGTRMDLMTETSEGARIRRVVCIVSRDGRHYLAAYGALDSEYEQFAAAMRQMLESVQLISP